MIIKYILKIDSFMCTQHDLCLNHTIGHKPMCVLKGLCETHFTCIHQGDIRINEISSK